MFMLKRSPYFLLILATCIWGGNFVAGKALVLHIPPITLAAGRWSIAFLCLLPFFGKAAWRLKHEFLAQLENGAVPLPDRRSGI